MLLFSHQALSKSLWSHGLQPVRLPCLSLSLRVCSTSCSLSQWCHPIIWSSVAPLFPAFNLYQYQGLFQFVSSSHQVSKVLELQLQHQSFQMNIQDLFPLGLTGLISLLSKGLSRVSSGTTIQKHQFFSTQPSWWSNSHLYLTTGKTTALTIRTWMNIEIWAISELKWIGRSEFNADHHYIYYWGQESLRSNGVALMDNKSPKCSTGVQSLTL